MEAGAAPALERMPVATGVPAGRTVRLRYRGNTAIGVRGPRSGRTYAFSASQPERAVDGRDVEAILKIGLFDRLG